MSAIAQSLLVWWFQELRDLAESLFAAIAPRFASRVFIRLGSDSGVVSIVRGSSSTPLASFACGGPGAWLKDLQGLPALEAFQEARAIVALNPELILMQEITLPDSVEADLESALALHVERDLPLPRDRALIHHRIVRRSRADRRFVVQLFVLHADRMDRIQELARAWRVRLLKVGVAADSKAVVGNFLRGNLAIERGRLSVLERRLAHGAIALTLVLLSVIGGQWIYERMHVGRALSDARDKAVAARQLESQITRAAAPASAISKLMSTPDAADILVLLTNSISSETWLYELDVRAPADQNAAISLSGFTPTATALVETLNKVPRLEKVRLISATSAGLGNVQDRLQVSAEYSQR